MGEIIKIPLRSVWKKAPNWDRASRAMKKVREVIKRKTKAEEVKIGKALNEKIWARGAKNPPTKVRVAVIEEEDGKYYADLAGVELEKKKEERRKKKAEEERRGKEEEETEEKSKEERLKEKYMRKEPGR